ncbi:uncharacterized protein TNCV_4155911 [Trichonephila clavipes]|nr:uncharacterized protein TNCV_4155911 [Trichonephila clavipes]
MSRTTVGFDSNEEFRSLAVVAWLVMSSNPVPLKTRRVEERCMLNLSRAQMSTRLCGVVVKRGGCQLKCRPRHFAMVQNYEFRCQQPSCCFTV